MRAVPLDRDRPRLGLRSLRSTVRDDDRRERRVAGGRTILLVLSAPGEEQLRRQPATARHGGHRLRARDALGHDPRLLLGRPRSPPVGPREDLEPPNRPRSVAPFKLRL